MDPDTGAKRQVRKANLSYILPSFDPATGTHLVHVYELLEKLGEGINLFVVIEKAAAPPSLSNVQFYAQRFRSPIFRMLELMAVLLLLRVRGYNVFYTHYSFFGAIASGILTRFLGGKSVYWNCGMMKEHVLPWRWRIENLRNRVLENDLPLRLSLRLVHRLATGTETMADYYSNSYRLDRTKVVVIPNWVNIKRFQNCSEAKEALRNSMGISTDTEVVLFAHRLSARKGAHLLPAIAAQVVKLRRQALFIVVGDGPAKGQIESSLVENGVRDHVRLVGFVPNQDIWRYFAIADLFIMPSEEEGFPRVLLESMAAGIPFVATDVGGVRDITNHAQRAFLVQPGDVAGFSKLILKLLEDQRLRSVLTEEGYLHVMKYDLERVAKMFRETVLGT